jgi:hypothetical protein
MAQYDAQIFAQWAFEFRLFPLSAVTQCMDCFFNRFLRVVIAFVTVAGVFIFVIDEIIVRFFSFVFELLFLVQCTVDVLLSVSFCCEILIFCQF